MMLLEHDAKELLAEEGLPLPAGRLVRRGDPVSEFTNGVVKAQVPVGGRGKAGGIVIARDPQSLRAAVERVLGITIKCHDVLAVRIESVSEFVHEAYFSLTLDAAAAEVTVMMSPHGGVDVEDELTRGDLVIETVSLEGDSLLGAVRRIATRMPSNVRNAIRTAGERLVPVFLRYEAVLLEINPLFIHADGGWSIGDTKMVIDENALPRCERLVKHIESQSDLYREASLKLSQGFDYVELDRAGDIGLITTGAGLSMQLVDELVALGHSPFNFCDIRTGQFKGDPGRLIQVMQWIAAGPNIRAVLVNFFAGHTNLGEVSRLFLQALAAVPELKAPIIARLIGNGLDEARAVIAEGGNPFVIETDLERAIDLATSHAERQDA